MEIKEILVYDWNYAVYKVTDEKKDLLCMCISVPLPNDVSPKIGMTISMLYAFSFNDIEIVKLKEQEKKEFLIEKSDSYFVYTLQGKIIDAENALVQVFNFKISLEYQFQEGLPAEYCVGDYITFKVDRIDCCIDLSSINVV